MIILNVNIDSLHTERACAPLSFRYRSRLTKMALRAQIIFGFQETGPGSLYAELVIKLK